MSDTAPQTSRSGRVENAQRRMNGLVSSVALFGTTLLALGLNFHLPLSRKPKGWSGFWSPGLQRVVSHTFGTWRVPDAIERAVADRAPPLFGEALYPMPSPADRIGRDGIPLSWRWDRSFVHDLVVGQSLVFQLAAIVAIAFGLIALAEEFNSFGNRAAMIVEFRTDNAGRWSSNPSTEEQLQYIQKLGITRCTLTGRDGDIDLRSGLVQRPGSPSEQKLEVAALFFIEEALYRHRILFNRPLGSKAGRSYDVRCF